MNDPHRPAPCPAPLWRAATELPQPPLPAEQDWLLDEGSLTRRLTSLAGGRFAVRPLVEGWQILRDDECLALGVPLASEGWVREVFLCGLDEPWVFARSVAARRALADSGLDLQTLGTRSLGELLFCDRAFTRGPLTLCRYPAEWLPVAARAPACWGRRSRFLRDGLGILVAEVFLPGLWRRLDENG